MIVQLELQQTRTQIEIERVKALQQHLESSANRFELLYQNAPVAYVTISEKGVLKDWNARAAALLDPESHGLLDVPISFFASRQDIHVVLEHLLRCKRADTGQIVSEFNLKRGDGPPVAVQLISHVLRENGEKFFQTALVDLTERKKNERALQDAKDFSDAIIQTVHEPLVVLDARLCVVRMNEAFAKLFQITPQIMKGLLFESALGLWWTGNELRGRLEDLLKHDVPLINFEFEAPRRDANSRMLLLNARRLHRGKDSEPVLLVAIEDITARKEAQKRTTDAREALQRLNDNLESRVESRTKELSDSNKQLESFCYSIAHDLRGPLRAMAGLGTLLIDDHSAQLDAKGKEYLERIVTAGQTMDRLIRDLLEYGRFNTVELAASPVDPDTVLNSVLANLQADISVKEAQIERKQKLPTVMGNAVALEAAFSNILTNALKFVPAKKKPKVSIWPEEQEQQIRIWIADNGIGIEPQYQRKIFEVFQRLHSQKDYPGTGIGLAIVQRAIQRSGGSVGVESEPGKGSRFWIDLPRAQ